MPLSPISARKAYRQTVEADVEPYFKQIDQFIVDNFAEIDSAWGTGVTWIPSQRLELEDIMAIIKRYQQEGWSHIYSDWKEVYGKRWPGIRFRTKSGPDYNNLS